MGRLPKYYGEREILKRVPYMIEGTLDMPAGAIGQGFPEGTFWHNQPKTFECHRMLVKLTALDANNAVLLPQPEPGLLERLVHMRIYDFKRKSLLTQTMMPITTMVKGFRAGGEESWEWADPYYMVRGQGFEITVDNYTAAGTAANTRLELSFQGFKINLGPKPKKARI